jgi:hypothetical protein
MHSEKIQNLFGNICEEIKKTSDICEYLQGDDAYFFLLKWAVGIESNKYNHNDNHVLGKLRSEWTKFLTNKPKRAKNLEPTLNMLFQDARCIRKHIQTQYGSTINNKQMPQFLLNIAKVCHDFTQLRAKGLTPQLSEKNEIIDSSSMLKISIEKISKDLKKIQLQTASDSNFLPSEISPKTKNRKKQSYMFNHAISIAKLNREYNIEYIDKMSSHEKSSGLSLIC